MKVAETVFNYFSSLNPIYSLFIDKHEVLAQNQKRMIRPYILDKYYHEIEKRIVELIDRIRLLPANPSEQKLQQLFVECKDFFLKEFHHNFLFFLSIVFQE